MGNIITKTLNTIDLIPVGEFFKIRRLPFFQKHYPDAKYKPEHYDASKEMSYTFSKGEYYHIILCAKPQSGKTSVMSLTYNMLSQSYIDKKFFLNIDCIFVIDGDNQNEPKEQNSGRLEKHCNLGKALISTSGKSACKPSAIPLLIKEWKKDGLLPLIYLKNSDFKQLYDCEDLKGKKLLKNCLIMIDESHYGSSDINSQLNKFLQWGGVDNSGDTGKLKKQNVFIVSVSATPYNEIVADKYFNYGFPKKKVVTYRPGEGYIGFEEFHKKGQIVGMDEDISSDVNKLKNFLKERQNDEIAKAKEKLGINGTVIIRLSKKSPFFKSMSEEEQNKMADKLGFSIYRLYMEGREKLDYDALYEAIERSQRRGGKPLLVIIKAAFGMSITIDKEIKKYIVAFCDYRPTTSASNPDNTEQGGLGRMCGYDETNKYLKIYLNKDHYEGLIRYYINNVTDVTKTVKNVNKETNVVKEVDFSEEIYAFNNKHLKPVVLNGKDVDKLAMKHPEWPWDKIYNGSRGTFLKNVCNDIINEMPIYSYDGDLLNEKIKKAKLIDRRVQRDKNDGYGRLGYTNPILSSDARKKWKENVKIGEFVYGIVFDVSKSDQTTHKGIEIRIAYGHAGYGKKEKIKSSGKTIERKVPEGFEKFEEVPMYV